MRIFSQNLLLHDISVPDDAILRINLAWVNHIDELKEILNKYNNYGIFLDLPIGRLKPPNNFYEFSDLLPIINSHNNIKYFAISNVNKPENLKPYISDIPKSVTLVPKIESLEGLNNIQEICEALGEEKIIMLDHDDLYSNLLKLNESENFKDYINSLIEFCEKNNIILLRTIGVVFSGDEKRSTQYVR